MKRRTSHTHTNSHTHSHTTQHSEKSTAHKYKVAETGPVGKRGFARSVLRQVSCEVSRYEGATAVEPNAIETLTDVLERLILEIAISGRAYCEGAGRTQSNLLDVRMALSDLDLDIGSLHEYARTAEQGTLGEIAIPKFPRPITVKKKKRRQRDQLASTALTEPPRPFPAHIPSYLPPFPADHTYRYTATYPKIERDPGDIRAQQSHEKCSVELGLAKFAVKSKSQSMVSLKPGSNMALLTAPAEPTFLGVITAQNGALYELNVNSAMPTINIDASNMDGDPEGGPEPGSAPTSPSDKDGNKSPSAATHNVSPNPSPAAKDHAARTAKVDGNPQ